MQLTQEELRKSQLLMLKILKEVHKIYEEDFVFGLLILKSFAEILKVDTPYMNKVLNWYGNLAQLELLDKNNNLKVEKLTQYPILQNFDINTLHDVQKFYNN